MNNALTWAWAQRPEVKGTGTSLVAAKAVLAALADKADELWEAWIGIETLCAMTGLTDGAARRTLAALVAAKLIEDTDERTGATGRVVVWRLIGEPVQIAPQSASRRRFARRTDRPNPSPRNGFNPSPGEVQSVPWGDRSKEDPTGTHKGSSPPTPPAARAALTKADVDGLFARWYSTYPKKADPALARRSFDKALRRAPFEALLAGAERYRDDPNREPGYTKNPSSWLNADAWLNEAEPPRGNGVRHPLDALQDRARQIRDARVGKELARRGG